MRCVFCPDLTEYKIDDELTPEKGEREHLFKILRAQPGEKVLLNDGKGTLADAEVVPNQKLRITDKKQVPEPEKKLWLFAAAPRKAKLDQLLKQATELGIWGIVLLNCEHSVAVPECGERHEALLIEAIKQSNNPFLPKLPGTMKFKAALEYMKEIRCQGCYGALENNGGEPDLHLCDNLAYWVGPEGGFSQTELETFKAEDFTGINLGDYILRLETAAIAAIPLLRRYQK